MERLPKVVIQVELRAPHDVYCTSRRFVPSVPSAERYWVTLAKRRRARQRLLRVRNDARQHFHTSPVMTTCFHSALRQENAARRMAHRPPPNYRDREARVECKRACRRGVHGWCRLPSMPARSSWMVPSSIAAVAQPESTSP